MNTFTKRLSWLSVLLGMIVGTAFAQHTAIPVVPGSKGALPEVPKLPQLEAGQFAGLEITFINGDYTNLAWPNISKFGGATSCELQYRELDGEWTVYQEMDAGRGEQMANSVNFDANFYEFRVVLKGGDMDGYTSNIVKSTRHSMSTVYNGYSSGGDQMSTFVDMKLGGGFNLTTKTYTEEGETEYTSEDGFYTYQWYRRNPNTYELSLIAGATESVYTTKQDDFGYQMILGISGDETHCSFTYFRNFGTVEVPVQASFEKFYVDGFILNTDYDIDPNSLIIVEDWKYGEENKTGTTLSATKTKPGQYVVRMSNKDYDYQMLNVVNSGFTLTSVYKAGWMDEPWYREVQILSDRYKGDLMVKAQLEGKNIPASFDVIGKNMDGENVIVDSFTFDGETADVRGAKTRRTRGEVTKEGEYIAYFYLYEGSYYVKARQTDAAMETYYPSTLLFSDAQAVQVETYKFEEQQQQYDEQGNLIEGSDFEEYQPASCVIDMKPVPAALEGSGMISGSVVKMDAGKTRAWFESEVCRVYLQKKNGDVVAQTKADANGAFAFKNVPYGEYQVLPDITCCNLATIQSVTLTEAAPSVASLDYVVDGDDIILKAAIGTMLALTVTDKSGNDVTGQVGITWYNAEQQQIAKGRNLRGLEEGAKVYYSITLDERLGTQLREVQMKEATFSNASLTCQLEEINKVILKGRVSALDIESNPASITIIQQLNGKYQQFYSTRTQNGSFSIEVFDDVTNLVITRPDCSDVTLYREGFDGNGDLGNIPMSLLAGVYLTVDVTCQPAVKTGEKKEDQAVLGGLSNFDITIMNGSTEITDYILQNRSILIKSGAKVGNTLTLTLKNKQGLYADAVGSITVADGTNNIMLDAKELGGIYATGNSKNASDIGFVYDANGNLKTRAIYSGEELNITHLESGDYTLVSMKNSQVIGNIQTLSSISQIGLSASDYVSSPVTVSNGAITTVNVGTIPSFDESALSRITENSYFNVNKSSTAIGEYLTFTTQIELKEVFAQNINNVALVVDFPLGCSYMQNSAMIGRTSATVSENGNRVTINLTKDNYQNKIRFCAMPNIEKEFTMTAYVSLDQLLQPIGSTQFVAKGFPISVPEKTGSAKITVSGEAPISGDIKVYDNDVLIGSTVAYWQGAGWSVECDLDKAYDKSFHPIYVKIKSGETELTSETKSVEYDPSMITPVSATILYYNREFDNTYNIKFDYTKGTTSHDYYYYYPFKYDDWWYRQDKEEKSFTFVADFTQNDPNKIKNIFFKVLATDGTIRTLPGTYDSKKQAWVATTKYWSSKLPINVSLDYDMLVSAGQDHEKGLLDQAQNMVNMSGLIYQYLAQNASATKISETDKSLSFSFSLGNIPMPFYGIIEELDYTTVETLMQQKQFTYADTEKGSFGSYAEWSDVGVSAVFADLKQKYATRLKLTLNNGQTRGEISQEDLKKYIGNLAKQFSNGGFIAGIGAYINKLLSIVGASDYFNVRKDFDNMRSIIENYSSNYSQLNADLTSSLNAKNADGSKRLDEALITQFNTKLTAISATEKAFILKYYKYMEAYQQKLLSNVITDVASQVFGMVLNTVGSLESFQSIKANGVLQGYQSISTSPNNTMTVLSNGLGYALNQIIAGTTNIATYTDYIATSDYILKWSSEQNLAILEEYAKLKELIREALKNSSQDNPYDEAYNDHSIIYQTPSTEPILDPSGYVYEGVASNRLAGVKTTVYKKNGSGEAELWDAASYGQENPLTTDANGFYQWNVPQGEWQVKYEKEGYETVISDWLPVPPPQLDVNQAMVSSTAPEVSKMKGYEAGIVIDMSKYMLVSSFGVGSVTVTRNGAAESGKIEMADEEALKQSDNKLTSKVRFVPEKEFLASDKVIVTVHNTVQSYSGVPMTADYVEEVSIEGEVKQIVTDETMTVLYNDSKKISVSVLPKEAAAGKKLNIKTSSAEIVSIDNNQVTIGEDGKASFTMRGELLGEAYISFDVAETEVAGSTKVTVVEGEIKEAITIGSHGQSAYVGAKDLDFSDDAVKAYIVSGCEGTTIWLTRVKDVPAGTPVLLRGEAGDYQIPVITSFTHYPENLLRGSATAASPIVPDENGYVNMYLSKKDGTFVKFASETTFPAGMSYLHMPVTSFAPSIAGDAQSITIPSSGKYTYCPPVDLDFTDVDGGLKAYTATGFEKSGKLWLTKVNKVQAGTPLFLKGDAGSYSVSSVGSQTEFANLFKGSATESTSLSTTTGEYTNYYVNKSGAFVLFGETPVDYPAGRSYLQIPTAFLAGGSAGTRSVEPVVIDSEDAEVILMEVTFGDGTTGIDKIQQSAGQDDVYYNLQGQRVDNPGKGLYIKNGKKVVIK